MSDMKCPFCGEILEQSSIYNLNSYACTDLTCKGYYMTATKDMWQELIRTRKELDVAVDALKRANNTYCAEEEDITIDLTESAAHKWQRTAYQMEMPISIALEQITALEQKDK